MTATSLHFYENILAGKGTGREGFDLTTACRSCDSPVPENADMVIGLYGTDPGSHFLVRADTEKGEKIFERLNLSKTEEPGSRKEAIEDIVSERESFRDKMFAETEAAIDSIEKLSNYLAGCINCYNCRVACPVCYCKECVFVTDVFNHDPTQYLKWANRKGMIKIPTDTLFYHITRLVHMSTACVGCGQCSNACPNDIPVMELFRTIAHRSQQAFDYEAGKSTDEEPPLSIFRENEFSEVVGIMN